MTGDTSDAVCRLGRWRLASVLGRGGFAKVFAGVDADGQKVAIKMSCPPRPRKSEPWEAHVVDGPTLPANIAAHWAASLGHNLPAPNDVHGVPDIDGLNPDNIDAVAVSVMTGVPLFRVKTSEDVAAAEVAAQAEQLGRIGGGFLPRLVDPGGDVPTRWFGMELIEGPTLRGLCRRRGGEAGLSLLPGLLDDLGRFAAEHATNPWSGSHGDLKPENLIVDGGRLRAIDPACHSITPAYNPLGLTGQGADLFAVAAIAFEFRTGRQPFLRYPFLHGFDVPYPRSGDRAELIRSDLRLEGLDARLDDRLSHRCVEWFAELPVNHAAMAAELRQLILA